jgi:hypothetical protein
MKALKHVSSALLGHIAMKQLSCSHLNLNAQLATIVQRVGSQNRSYVQLVLTGRSWEQLSSQTVSNAISGSSVRITGLSYL